MGDVIHVDFGKKRTAEPKPVKIESKDLDRDLNRGAQVIVTIHSSFCGQELSGRMLNYDTDKKIASVLVNRGGEYVWAHVPIDLVSIVRPPKPAA